MPSEWMPSSFVKRINTKSLHHGFPNEHREAEGEAPSGSAGGGGDASLSTFPNEHREAEGEAPSGSAGGGGDASLSNRKYRGDGI